MIKILSKDINIISAVEEITEELSVKMGIIDPNYDCFSISCQLSMSNPLIVIIDGDYFFSVIEIIKEIRESLPDTIIIFITSDTDVESCKKVYVQGVNYYTTKPVRKEELRELIINNLFHNKHK